MAFITQIVRTISGTGDRNHPYGTISTYSNTTVNDSDVLTVTLNGTLLTLTTDYTVDDSTAKQIILDTSLTIAANDTLVIARDTDIDNPYVDYTNNTLVDADDLDLSNKQFLFKLQELDVKTDGSVTLDLSNNYWDGQGYATYNFAPAVLSSGLTTLAQVQDMLAGVSTATINNTTDWTLTGTGAQTSFDLTNAPQGLADPEELIVYVNNVPQVPDVGYGLDVSGVSPAVTFTTAPASGDVIYVRAFSGTVSTTFGDNSVTESAIADNSIGIRHLMMGTGSTKRVVFYGTDGQPDASDARVIVLNDIFDWPSAPGTGTLTDVNMNNLELPTASVDMNTHKFTNLVSGTAGTADSCTVAQMETHVTSSLPTANSYPFHHEFAIGEAVSASLGFVPTAFMGKRGNTATGNDYSFDDVSLKVSTTLDTASTSGFTFQITGGDSKTLTITNTSGALNNLMGTIFKTG